jgi:hypothetical protein
VSTSFGEPPDFRLAALKLSTEEATVISEVVQGYCVRSVICEDKPNCTKVFLGQCKSKKNCIYLFENVASHSLMGKLECFSLHYNFFPSAGLKHKSGECYTTVPLSLANVNKHFSLLMVV